MSGSLKRSLAKQSAAGESSGKVSGWQPASKSVAAFPLSPEQIKQFVELYAANSLFENSEGWIINDNPYRRPIGQALVSGVDFSKPLARGEVSSAGGLLAHRMLLNIYESDLIFLPESELAARWEDFSRFYSNENKVLGELIRPTLENYVFGFLKDEITVTGEWTAEALRSYLASLLEAHEQTPLEVVTAILSSKNPEKNALAFLVQAASDFLSEASATARNTLGKYGALQSELFKIVIDDYGYGVHQAKHSTLFEKTMASCGLSTQAHSYWQFYLGSSLALGNYYHYVSRDHSKLFRCLGAIAYAETMFAHTCKEVARMLREVFGRSVDSRYFDEHGHIDAHHGRMALDNLVIPAITKYGDKSAWEIVRGLEEIGLLTAIADADFMAQTAWADDVEMHMSLGQRAYTEILSEQAEFPAVTHSGPHDVPPIIQVYDDDKLLAVEAGAMSFVAGHDRSVYLSAGQAIMIPRHRMHGMKAESAACVYHIYDIGDYKSCLS